MKNFENYKLTMAETNELAVAVSFINEARAFLKANGVDQWQKEYPNEDTIKKDIEARKGYFLTDGEKYTAYMCIDFDGEPAYDELNGKWLSESSSYGVVHRLAVSNEYKGSGLASVSFKLAEELMREKKVKSFRIDTDENNEIMKHLLAKNGFTYCGTIRFDDSIKIAYEKLI